MSRELDFFFFFGSGYAYLSVMRIEALAARAGVTVNWRPFSVRELVNEQGNNFRNVAPRMAYLWRDIERRAAQHGVPFVRKPVWPTDLDQLANRVGVLAATEGWCPEYSRASFRSWYLGGEPLGEIAPLSAVLRQIGRDPDSVIARANSAAIRARYDAETDAARQLGAFGSPTFTVGGEIFWGDDRLSEALAWATDTHPAQHVGPANLAVS